MNSMLDNDDGDGDGDGDWDAKSDVGEDESLEMRKLVVQHNKKKKKSGGFQSMGLSNEIFKGVMKKGYRVPTPIQRKAVPVILEGRDVVAMARTGSGKTAAFLVPLFQRLHSPNPLSGARSLILSPTRELALQTLKFTRELGKFTQLSSVCVLGGESMEKQFALMHEKPDIIIATPGRFVHLCVEMGLKLESIEYVVFDEADRLFEMGFGEQLREILGRLPAARQTVLFSATLPKMLVEFAKAGLSDPTLIRLDVDTKIPETLKLGYFHCRDEGKSCVLLHLLKHVIPQEQQAVVFCATRHHVEYLHIMLDIAGITNTFIYSQLDSTARKIHAAKFQARKARVLLVTDLAARGIDIPLLDNVINYNFPAKSKLFIHRVGRVARAGRTGQAFSLVAGDETAYYIDLQLFLGNAVTTMAPDADKDAAWHNVLGQVPQYVYDDHTDMIESWHDVHIDLYNMRKVAANGMKQYLKSRQGASSESVKRARKIKLDKTIGTHPLLVMERSEVETQRYNILEEMKRFRPPSTIFEIGNTAKSSKMKSIMVTKRSKHDYVISKFHVQNDGNNEETPADDEEEGGSRKRKAEDEEEMPEAIELEEAGQDDVDAAFNTIVQPKAVTNAKVFVPKKKKKREPKVTKDEENYIGYVAKDHHTEAGYSLTSTFENEARGAVLDLTGDSNSAMRMKKNAMKWDIKKKKYVRADMNEKKKIKTESGVWIPASYKSNRYKKWMDKSKLGQMAANEALEDDGDRQDAASKQRQFQGLPANHPAMIKAKNALPKHKKGPKREIKRPEEILKQRKEQEKQRVKNMRRGKRKAMKK